MHVATVTIDHNRVAADLTDYVVLVVPNSDAGWAQLYAEATEGGGDIRVYKSDGVTELPREIVSFSVSAETGEIYLKYSGTLSSTVDTDIHIYADGVSADYAVTDTYGRNAVWTGFSFVYHLNNNANSSTGSNNGTPTGITYTDGNIGRAAVFASTSSARIFTPAGLLTNVGTASVWFKSDSTTQGNVIYGCTKVGTSDYLRIAETTGNKMQYVNRDNTINGSTNRGTGWNYAVNAWDTATAWKGNLNGSVEVTGSGVRNPTNTFQTVFGCLNDGNSVYGALPLYFNGQISEARLRTTRSSDSWITTEYNNQGSPTTFYSVAVASSPNVTVTPVAQSVTASVPAYNVLLGSTVSPSSQNIAASIPAYAISLPKTISPLPQEMALNIPAYVIDAGGNITVAIDAQQLTLSVPVYSVVFDKIVSVNPQNVTALVPAYGLNIGTSAVIGATTQEATLTIPTYNLSVQRSIIIEVLAQVLTLSLPTLTKSGGIWTRRSRSTDSDWSRRGINNN